MGRVQDHFTGEMYDPASPTILTLASEFEKGGELRDLTLAQKRMIAYALRLLYASYVKYLDPQPRVP
jgi:hypothetical protein